MNLPDLNHLVCEWLNLEKKKRIKKIKVKNCVGIIDKVLREKKKKKLCGTFWSWEEVVGKKRGKNEKKKRIRVRVWRRKKKRKKEGNAVRMWRRKKEGNTIVIFSQ